LFSVTAIPVTDFLNGGRR